MRVESSVLALNRRYNFVKVGLDPYQAILLQQRLQRQGVKCTEVPFSGGNLNNMATVMLDAFRSRRIKLYDHSALIRDIGRLSLTEKSYGWRLEGTRDSHGHCDLGTALAIALPLAVEEAGKPGWSLAGVSLDAPRLDGAYSSEFSQALSAFEHTSDALSAHERYLASLGDDDISNVQITCHGPLF